MNGAETNVCISGEEKRIPIYSGLYKSLIQYVDINKIKTNPRKLPGDGTVAVFAGALEKDGFLRPILLSEDGAVADGVKRLAAASSLGYTAVPCITAPTPLVFEDDLIIQKLRTERPGMFEYASLLQKLTVSYLYSQENVALALGRSQSFVANKLRLLTLTDEERSLILGHGLSERHCRALLRIKNEKLRLASLKYIIAFGLSVGAAEEYLNGITASDAGVLEKIRRELSVLLARYPRVNLSVSSSYTDSGEVMFITLKI